MNYLELGRSLELLRKYVRHANAAANEKDADGEKAHLATAKGHAQDVLGQLAGLDSAKPAGQTVPQQKKYRFNK